MLQLTINEKGGPTRHETFDKDEVTIGRVQGNDIILPKGNISKRHSRIVLKDGKFIIVDLKSTNGTYVNGKKITAPQVIKTTDKVYIGDFTIQISQGANGAEEQPARGRAIPGAEEEIDLFGGDAPFDGDPAAAQSPGLIDDNFDKEFDVPSADPNKAHGSLVAGKRSPGRRQEPEPELELDEDFGAPDEPDPEPPRLEIDGGFEPPPESRELHPMDAAAEGPLGAHPSPHPRDRSLDPMPPDLEETPPPDLGAGFEGAATAMPGPSVEEPAPDGRSPSFGEASFEVEGGPLAGPGARAPGPAGLGQAPLAPSGPSHGQPSRGGLAPFGPANDLGPMLGAPGPMLGLPAPSGPAPEPLSRDEALVILERAIHDALDLTGRPLEAVPELREEAESVARSKLEALVGRLPAGEPNDDLVARAVARTTGIGPILDLLVDDTIFEVVVSADRQVLVDREGRLEPTERVLQSDAEVLALVHALAGLGGMEPGRIGPLVDVRLRSGPRVLATLPPAAFRGPSLTVRKTTRDFFTLEKLQEYDSIGAAMVGLLEAVVRFRRSVLLSIGPGVSATATLNALLSRVPDDERVVTVERGVELYLRGHVHAVAFTLDERTNVKDVLRYAASAQSERVFFGELAREDAGPVVDAFSLHLEGGAAAIVAGSAEEAVDRLARWVEEYREAGPEEARRAVARAFPIVLQEHKLSDNSRRITQAAELVVEDGEVRLHELFRFEPSGVDESMMITGAFVPAGRVPAFLEALAARGEIQVDVSAYQVD